MTYIWTTADGDKIPVNKMADSHLHNAFFFSLRKICVWCFNVSILGFEIIRRKFAGIGVVK